jgi:hypothetical protein
MCFNSTAKFVAGDDILTAESKPSERFFALIKRNSRRAWQPPPLHNQA